jgi:hypothetical protein
VGVLFGVLVPLLATVPMAGARPGVIEQAAACSELRITTVVHAPASKRATFSAVVSSPPKGITYSWKSTSGKPLRGNTSMMFTIQGTGSITATVTIGGLPSSCKNTASATVEIK